MLLSILCFKDENVRFGQKLVIRNSPNTNEKQMRNVKFSYWFHIKFVVFNAIFAKGMHHYILHICSTESLKKEK